MRIIQLLPTLSSGDAVGNEALAIDRAIRKKGIETAIYAENIDRRLPAGTAQPYDRFPKLSPEDIILYHASTGTRLNYEAMSAAVSCARMSASAAEMEAAFDEESVLAPIREDYERRHKS